MRGPYSPNTERKQLAEAFDQPIDPLARHESTFEALGIDLFDVYEKERLAGTVSDGLRTSFAIVIQQWKQHLKKHDRHPACPNEGHVHSFIDYLLDERKNQPATVKEKLRKLNQIYRYWQADPSVPHSRDYSPFEVARTSVSFEASKPKEPPHIPLETIRESIQGITCIRDRTIVCLQLKLGLRATEVCNLELGELHLGHGDLKRHYPSLGTHPLLEGRPNAIYIAHDRPGNKSRRPRVLPLDDELQDLLTRYVLIRPDTGDSWVFLSKNGHQQLRKKAINRCWKAAFHPEYAETEQHRAVTSHYGRHRFTTYWRVEQELPLELVKYLRGDTPGPATIEEMGAVNSYIHTYYEDIEELCRNGLEMVSDSAGLQSS